MQFNYLEPKTIKEATSLLSKYDRKAKVIAGGTDLLVQIGNRAIEPEYLVDISYIPGLDYIDCDDKQGLRIGALTTIRIIEKSDKLRRMYPVISQAAGLLGSTAIRNVGTIGGNLCNAAPSADSAPALIGLSSRAKIVGPRGERTVPVEDFFTGPGGTVLRSSELLVEIQVPVLSPNIKGVYLKHAIRKALDLAIIGVAVVTTMNGDVLSDIKIVLGAVAPTPIRAKKAEAILVGKKISEELLQKAGEAAADESSPIDDVRSSADYRRQMVRVLVARAVKQAAEQVPV